MKISQLFNRIPYKKYIAGFLVSAILISQTIHVDFFDRVEAGPENYRDIVSIIVDRDTYGSQRSKIMRYAEDVAGYLGGVRTSILVVEKDTPVATIATKNEKLYYEGDGEQGTSSLVGTVLIGNIPVPVVQKDGAIFSSLYPYVDFDDKTFLYNPKTTQYEYQDSDNGTESVEIWHGVINPAVGRSWSGATDITKIGQFLDKTHEFYTKSGKFVPSIIPPKVFYYDGLSESKSINARALYQYGLYIKNIENISYNRFTKYLLRDISRALADFDKKDEDPEMTAMYASLGIAPGTDTLTEDQIKKLPDIQSKTIILSFLKNFKSIFNEKTLGDELLGVHNAGRYNSGSTVRADIVPVSITLMDNLAYTTLREANTALEEKIDALLVNNKYARRIPIFDEVQSSVGEPNRWDSAHTQILQNYAFGARSTTIATPLDCSIARGVTGNVTDFGRSQLVEANVAFDIMKTEEQTTQLSDDTNLLVGMGQQHCFPGDKPNINSYWGGNSILRVVGSSTSDPAEVLETFPSVQKFLGFTAPIFSLGGMKESTRLPINSVKDCLKSPYQYTLSPARRMTDIDPATGETITTAYPSEWSSGGGTPRFTCISNVASAGTVFDLETSINEYSGNGTPPSIPSGIFSSSIQGDCLNGTVKLDGTDIARKSNICTITQNAYDGSGNTMAGEVVDITHYKNETYHTIPSLLKHTSPTDEEIAAATANNMTPSLAVDTVRYVEFYTPKGNIAQIHYPNFFNIPSTNIASARAWITAQANTEWQKIINAENSTTTSASYNRANGYLQAGAIPATPIDWNQYISDEMLLKIIQAKNWIHPDISLKYRKGIEAILSYSHENTTVTPLVETPPKIPSLSTEYEIAYLGLPSTFGADFSQATYSDAMAEYEAKLREIEGVNISQEETDSSNDNPAAECGPPDGVPLLQWPSAIICWITKQFPPKIFAGSCAPTQIGIDSPDGKSHTSPSAAIAFNTGALTAFYAGSQVVPYLPRTSMQLNESISVDLSLQKNGVIVDVQNNTIANLEIVAISAGGKAIDRNNFSRYLNISPSAVTVGEKGASFILESLGTPAVVTLKGYYTQTLPDESQLRTSSSEFQVYISPEYYALALEQSGSMITNVDVTTSDSVFLRTQKILENGSGVSVSSPLSIQIIDDVSGVTVYSGSSFNPASDALPLDIVKKIGVYRIIIRDKIGISGEITFAVQSGALTQVRIVPVSSALVQGTKTLAMVRLLDRLGNLTSPMIHTLKLEVVGGYMVDANGEKKTSMSIDLMESQVPIVIGADSAGTLRMTASVDDSINTSKDITIYSSARIVLMRESNPRVGGENVLTHIEIQDEAGKRMTGLSSVASWKFPDGAGSFSKETITITDGISENFEYIPGTVSGNHTLSIDIPGIGSLSDLAFSLLPGDPLYVSHTKDESNIIFSLRDRYGNIASLSSLAGTLTRNNELSQSVIFSDGVYKMPLQGGYYNVDVPGLKNYSISYTDELGVHTVQGIEHYMAYIVGNDEQIHFAPDYNARYTVLAGGSFLREGEDILYNVIPGGSQSLAVSTTLDSPTREDMLVSILPGGAYYMGGSSQDIALQSSISLSDGFPLLTVSDDVTRKQVARVLYRMQGATLEVCQEMENIDCNQLRNQPTIRLVVPDKSALTATKNNNSMVLNSSNTNVITVNNDGSIGLPSGVSLVPKNTGALGLEMSVMQENQQVARLIYMMDQSLSVEKLGSDIVTSSFNTPIILSSGFFIKKIHADPLHYETIGYKILGSADSVELDETKNGPSHTDSIGALSEIPGVGWLQNNTMLLAYAGGDTVGEATKFFHTYSLVNLGDPVAHINHGRPGTEIDGIDRTIGSIVARGTRSGIANFFHRDMDADGIQDMIVIYQDGYIELLLNRSGKFRSRGMIAYNKDIDTSNILFGDFIHDGYGDIIGLNKDGGLVLVDNSNRRFSRLNITLQGGVPLPKHISQFKVYDMDADGFDDIVYISAMGELGVLYGTSVPASFVKKVLDPTLGISLSTDPILTGGAIKTDSTPQIQGALGVSPTTSTGGFDESMLNDEVYYQYQYSVPQSSSEVDIATLSGTFSDIAGGATGDRQDTYVRSQYATAHGLDIQKTYTNTTHSTLYPDDRIEAHITIKNNTTKTIRNIEYLDTLPKIFSIEKTDSYSVRAGGTSIDRTFESVTSTDYDMHFIGRDLAPGETMEIVYTMIALPASYGQMIVGDLEKNTAGADNYGDVGFKTSTTCGATMLRWASGPGSRDYIRDNFDFGSVDLPDGLADQLADSDNNQVPDSVENMSLADRQQAYTDITTAETKDRPLIKVDQNGGEMTIGFDDGAVDAIIDATQYLMDGLACGFGGASCVSFPMNWAPLAPGSDPSMFGKLLGDGLKVDEGLPIFSALTCRPQSIPCGNSTCSIGVPTVWPASKLSYAVPMLVPGGNNKMACTMGLSGAGGKLGVYSPPNFLRVFVTPTLTLGMGVAVCLGGPAALQGRVPPPALSPLVKGGNCIVITKSMKTCKGDGSEEDGDVSGISGLGILGDTWNASSCKPQANVITEAENRSLTTDIIKYLKVPDQNKLTDLYGRLSRRGAQSASIGPLLRVTSASGGGSSDLNIEIDSNTKVSDIGKVVKLNNKRIPAFPDFMMDWLTRQTEELVTALFTPPNLTIVMPTDLGQNAQIDGSYSDFSKKLGDAYSSSNLSNISQGISRAGSMAKSTVSNASNNTMQSNIQNAKGTLNVLKSAYTEIGKLPFIKIQPVKIPFNIPWINASELDKYSRALDGYMKEIDNAASRMCVNDPSAACLDKKAKLQSGPFVASIKENLKRIEEYKRFPMKVQRYLTWKERYIAQILCNIETVQKITSGWLKSNGLRFRKWAELFVLIKSIADSWQPLLDIFNDASKSCGVCRNERGDLKDWKIKLISSLIPSIPVLKFPKWPDIVLDLSDIRFAIVLSMPDFDPRISPIRLPNLPSLSLGDLSASLSLPALPVLPSLSALPPLPDLPDLPSLPRIKLPDLPPPPKLPKIGGSIQMFLKVMKLMSLMYCYYQKTTLVPEWQVGDVIAQRTERQATSIFDFITVQLPSFSLPSVKEIRVGTHVNFEMRSDFITEFSRAAVKPVNEFGTDLRRAVPSKVGTDIGIGNTRIDLNKKLPYNIEEHNTTLSGAFAQIFEQIDLEKDEWLDVDEFISYLSNELDVPEFLQQKDNLQKDLAIARIESENIQNELIAYNEKRFALLRNYLSAENDKNAQLQNIINLLQKEVSGEPRHLIADIETSASHSTTLLSRFNEYQDDQGSQSHGARSSIQISGLDYSKNALSSKLSRMIAANAVGSTASTTSNIATGYSPNYQGIYVRTPSGIQTQLFDYKSPITEDTRVDIVDIDRDGDDDYIYILDDVLYVKYSWQQSPNKIQDTAVKITTLDSGDLSPYIPDYFYENTSTPRELNFSFMPASHDEREWRVEFFDRYIEWDHVDFGDSNPSSSPKTTLDMFLPISEISLVNTPIIATPIARSLESVRDTASFVIEGRNIEVYTGALSISLSPGRVLYTGRNSVAITYKVANTTNTETITLDPYTGYEFSDITEIATTGGLFYLIGAEDQSRYVYSDEYRGLPILPGMRFYASDAGATIRNHTSGSDDNLAPGSTYIAYDLGTKSDRYDVSVPYANGYYYARIQNLTMKKTDRAGVILFAPQATSDDGAPIIDLPDNIRIPIFHQKSFKISDVLTDLSQASISIDNDTTTDDNANGVYDDDFALSGTTFTISNSDLVFGKFQSPGNYSMNMKAIDEMGNTTIMPFTVEAYSPIPKIQSVVGGNIQGSIPEEIIDTPIHFFRVRSGELPSLVAPVPSPTDILGHFGTGSFFKSPEQITFSTAMASGSIDSHGVFTVPAGYHIAVSPATQLDPMQLLVLNNSGSILYKHTLILPDDVRFVNISTAVVLPNTGIFITPNLGSRMSVAGSTDASIPGGIYISDAAYQPLLAMARDGNIYSLDKTIDLRYGVKNGYMMVEVIRENAVVSTIEYHIDFFYTMK